MKSYFVCNKRKSTCGKLMLEAYVERHHLTLNKKENVFPKCQDIPPNKNAFIDDLSANNCCGFQRDASIDVSQQLQHGGLKVNVS